MMNIGIKICRVQIKTISELGNSNFQFSVVEISKTEPLRNPEPLSTIGNIIE